MSYKKESLKNDKKIKIKIKEKNFFNFKLKKYMITQYKNKGLLSERPQIKKNGTLKNLSTSNYYYKNPFFYNEENLNLQLKILRELQKINNRYSTPIQDNSNINRNSYNNTNRNINRNNMTKYSTNFSLNKNYSNIETPKKINTLKRANLSFEDTNTNLKLPQISKNINNDIRVEISDNHENNINTNNFLRNNNNSVNKINKEKLFNITSINKTPIKIKENEDLFYKVVFESKHLFKSEKKKIIDNKLNIIYAENEEQYKNIIEKEYKKLLSEGKKVKNKNIAPSTKLKIDEAKERIHFMKGIIDYTFPEFLLYKLKMIQKRLKPQKNSDINLECVSGADIRDKIKKTRNNFRKEYLLKSIKIFNEFTK